MREYWTGLPSVSPSACHAEASRLADKAGERSIVHAHLHGEDCNDHCTPYGPSEEVAVES